MVAVLFASTKASIMTPQNQATSIFWTTVTFFGWSLSCHTSQTVCPKAVLTSHIHQEIFDERVSWENIKRKSLPRGKKNKSKKKRQQNEENGIYLSKEASKSRPSTVKYVPAPNVLAHSTSTRINSASNLLGSSSHATVHHIAIRQRKTPPC